MIDHMNLHYINNLYPVVSCDRNIYCSVNQYDAS